MWQGRVVGQSGHVSGWEEEPRRVVVGLRDGVHYKVPLCLVRR